jgi:hypothetical protein
MAHPGPNPAIYTPERESLIRRDWPSDRPSQLILADFNALPGRELAMRTVQNYAADLGIPRSGTGKAATLAHSRGSSVYLWSEARTAYLAAHWATDLPPETLAARAQRLAVVQAINAMPGPQVTDKACKQKAMREGISRKRKPTPEPEPVPTDRHVDALERAGVWFQDVPEMQAFAPYVPIMSRPDPMRAERLARHAEQARQAHRNVATPSSWGMLG